MRAILPIVFLMVLSAVEGSNNLQASTQAGRNTLTPVDLVNSFFRKGPKTHSEGEQQAAAAIQVGEVEDLDALMDESENPENLEESTAGDDGLDLAADEAMQASEAESLDEGSVPLSHTKATSSTKAEGQKKKSKPKEQEGAQGSQQGKRKTKKAQKGKNVPIIITIEPSGDMHLEVPNARIIKGRS